MKVPNKQAGSDIQFIQGENHRKSLIWYCERSEATFTFWLDKSSSKMPIMVHFGDFLKTWSLQSNSVTRLVTFNKSWWKMPKLKNSNVTFWVIFKHFEVTQCTKNNQKSLIINFIDEKIKRSEQLATLTKFFHTKMI